MQQLLVMERVLPEQESLTEVAEKLFFERTVRIRRSYRD